MLSQGDEHLFTLYIDDDELYFKRKMMMRVNDDKKY